MYSNQAHSALFLLGSILLVGSFSSAPVNAANHYITTDRSSFDCRSAGVGPGDTVTIGGTSRGPLTISNCKGTTAKRITIRNDTSQLSQLGIRKTDTTDGGFVLRFTSNQHVTVDGTGKWKGAPPGTCGIDKTTLKEHRNACGIKVVQISKVNPAAYIQIDGHSSFMTFKGIEVEGISNFSGSTGGAGIGIQLNDHSLKIADFAGSWYQGFLFENLYVHNTAAEGLYIGPNWKVGDFPLRDIQIAYVLVEDPDRNGIKIKSSIAGSNSMHHNHIYRTGRERKTAGHGSCVSFFEGGGVVHNNLLVDCGENGINFFTQHVPFARGPFPAIAYNNVVVNTGLYGPIRGLGISVGRKTVDLAEFVPEIYNNTIVNTGSNGIGITSKIAQSGFVRDNIVAGAKEAAISIQASNIRDHNNWVGSVDEQRFADPGSRNFNLTASSPSWNAATSGCPSTDRVGTSRPQNKQCDQGAFELAGGAGSETAKPNPPELVSRE